MNIFFKFIFVSLDRGDSKCRKAVASSGAIWAESNFKNSLSFAGKNKVRRKVASGTGCAHEGSGEPVLLQGLLSPGCPPGPWHFAVVPPKEIPLALPVFSQG